MEIRDLTLDDLDAALDSRRRSFGPISPEQAANWRRAVAAMLPERRCLGAFEGTRLVAAARINQYTQWWHGRPVPIGGLAGVAVAPEDRGRGVAVALVRAAIDRCAELGDLLCALYPATTPLYRNLGWEHAGALLTATLPAEALRTVRGPEVVKLRRMGPDDAPEVVAALARLYRATRASGPVCCDERTWRRRLGEDDDFCYLAEDGYVIYRWRGLDVEVDNLVAGSPATARALWSLVGSASSIADSVTTRVEPHDPVLWLVRERTRDQVGQTRWMLRLVDLPAAIERRGFPATVSVRTVLEVDDPVRPGNTGRWRLHIDSGSGTATPEPGQPAAARLTIGGLSALYAGVPTATLRRTDLLAGGSADLDEALDAAFHCTPYMIDYF